MIRVEPNDALPFAGVLNMTFDLSFSRREPHSSLGAGINPEPTLCFGQRSIGCDAKVDTGAEVRLFQRAVGAAVDITIEAGVKR